MKYKEIEPSNLIIHKASQVNYVLTKQQGKLCTEVYSTEDDGTHKNILYKVEQQ